MFNDTVTHGIHTYAMCTCASHFSGSMKGKDISFAINMILVVFTVFTSGKVFRLGVWTTCFMCLWASFYQNICLCEYIQSRLAFPLFSLFMDRLMYNCDFKISVNGALSFFLFLCSAPRTQSCCLDDFAFYAWSNISNTAVTMMTPDMG